MSLSKHLVKLLGDKSPFDVSPSKLLHGERKKRPRRKNAKATAVTPTLTERLAAASRRQMAGR